MAYSSALYLFAFLGLTILGYIIVPKKYKWVVLLASSYIFYLINSSWRLVFILISTLIVYFAGMRINKINDNFKIAKKELEKEEKKKLKLVVKKKKKTVVTLSVVAVFGLLVGIKYCNFLFGTVNGLIDLFGAKGTLPEVKFILPLGISYYTLMATSYIVDVYRGKYKATNNLGKIALYLSFFPGIVEGPLSKYDQLAGQLYEGHKFDYTRFLLGAERICWGMIKKVVIADRANIFVGEVFGHYQNYHGVEIVLAVLMYTLQIYAEFSGCMDIVIGSAQIFGIEMPENFQRPFFSKSIDEFWRRWHITLGVWIKNYIFYPVSLSKPFMNLSKWARKHLSEYYGGLIPISFALFFVWAFNGFWHGASWKYVCYGLYYYVLMMLAKYMEPLFLKIFKITKINRKSKPFQCFQIFRTFIVANIGMMLFRAKDFTAFGKMFVSMFDRFSVEPLVNGAVLKMGNDWQDFLIIILGFVAMLVVGIVQENGHDIRQDLLKKNIVFRTLFFLAMILIVIVFGAYGDGYGKVDFIYGQF